MTKPVDAEQPSIDIPARVEALLKEKWSTPAGLRAHVLRYGPEGYDIQSPEERAELERLRAGRDELAEKCGKMENQWREDASTITSLLAQLAIAEQKHEDAMTDVINERDGAEGVIVELCRAIGWTPEWTSAYDFNDAIEEAKERVHALEQRADLEAKLNSCAGLLNLFISAAAHKKTTTGDYVIFGWDHRKLHAAFDESVSFIASKETKL